MKLHEFQSKALLRQFGIPVPESAVADSASAAVAAAAALVEQGYEIFAVKARLIGIGLPGSDRNRAATIGGFVRP